MSDYSDALRAAGCEIIGYQEFGSYSGDWFAKVRYDGEVFWLHDYYGSCSVCDALQADMGYEPWNDDAPEEWADYNKRLAEWGARYLEPQERLTYEQALKVASENIDWDADAQDMVNWLQFHRDAV